MKQGRDSLNKEIFGENLRNLRRAKKLTQKKLGELLGKKESTVRMWELGKSTPPPDSIEKISEVLEEDYVTLMKRAGYIPEKIEFPFTPSATLLRELADAVNSGDDRKKISLTHELEEIRKMREAPREEKDIAKRLEQFCQEIESSDILIFDGDPMSEEAKESLIESMEHIFRQTQRINKMFAPNKNKD